MVLTRYQDVLRRPHVTRLLVTSMLARLPQGMSGLAILLFLTPHLGYGRAGLATGLTVATAGISNVVLARSVDRIGARRVLGPSAALYAAGMLWLAAADHAHFVVQLAICAVIGLVTPPISSVSRGLWPRVLSEEQAQVIYGLEATAQEFVYISGPAAVALTAGLTSARIAVIVSGLIGLAGALAYISAPPFAAVVGGPGSGRGQRVLRSGALRYAAVGMFLVLGFSMTDIATVDFVSGRSASAKSGVVLAIWSFGSLLGGLWFGASNQKVSDRSLASVVAITASGLALAAVSPDVYGLTLILLLSGAAIAPTLARLYTRMSAVAPDGATTEAFGWLAVGFLAGASLGSALGGVSVDGIGPRWTFLLAGCAVLCALPVIAARRPVTSSRGG
ncbi:MAG TPA: MFS transporter [Mycobacteriales bacterium]|jgi:MFS family permease|nr:MFS transporter [Mycobacteriales bacterium]